MKGILSISCRHFRRKWRLGGDNSNSDSNNSNSSSNSNSSCVEVLSGVVFSFGRGAAVSGAPRRGAARSALGIHFPLIWMQFGP